jgi:hypothetical protein
LRASPRRFTLGEAVLRSYEIVLADECVGVRDAPTAQLALIEHLRIAGCDDEDIVRLGTRSVAWRGAVYRAVLARQDDRALKTRQTT